MPHEYPEIDRAVVFGFRSFIYLFSLGNFLFTHFTKFFHSFRKRDFIFVGGVLPIPSYLAAWQESAGFVLTMKLTMMLILEPIAWCWRSPEAEGKLFLKYCHASEDKIFAYSVFSMISMFIYFALLIDLAVFSTRVSAYVLVCLRMFSEVGLFLLALSLFILMFAAAVSVVKHDTKDFAGIPPASLALFKMFMRMYIVSDYAQFREEPVILICICVFLLSSAVFLLNLLIAQLTCAYTSVYVDMVGFARLQRIEISVNTIPTVSGNTWDAFVSSLNLDKKLEFNEGDIGLAGGVQRLEPASANPTTIDQIRRFGGSTSREMP
jgi:hypothetical protein